MKMNGVFMVSSWWFVPTASATDPDCVGSVAGRFGRSGRLPRPLDGQKCPLPSDGRMFWGGHRLMIQASEQLALAREHFVGQRWESACAAFSDADLVEPLDVVDLDTYAEAARISGRIDAAIAQ